MGKPALFLVLLAMLTPSLYALGAFVAATFDITTWDPLLRATLAVTFVGVVALGVFDLTGGTK